MQFPSPTESQRPPTLHGNGQPNGKVYTKPGQSQRTTTTTPKEREHVEMG